MSPAAKVAAEKAEYPERFCPLPRCLWRVLHRGGPDTPCRKHQPRTEPDAVVESHGSVCLVQPMTAPALDWLKENTDGTWFGALVGEGRRRMSLCLELM